MAVRIPVHLRILTVLDRHKSPAKRIHQWARGAQIRGFHSALVTFGQARSIKNRKSSLIARGVSLEESINGLPHCLERVQRSLENPRARRSGDRKFWLNGRRSSEWAQKSANEFEFTRHCLRQIRRDLDHVETKKDGRDVVENHRSERFKPGAMKACKRDPSPQPDILNTHCTAVEYPKIAAKYGSLISPLTDRPDEKLRLPFEVIEIKSTKGKVYEALLQNLNSVYHILDSRYLLLVDFAKGNYEAAKAHLRVFPGLSVIFTPSKALLYGHWANVNENGSLYFEYACLREWNLPEEVEQASTVMQKASRAMRKQFCDRISPILESIENRLNEESVFDEHASPTHGFFTGAAITRI